MNPIVVIDSGIGGLTVFDAIHQQLPQVPLVYCFDNAAFPYGDKSECAVTQRIMLCVEQLYKYFTPAMVVVACNTASTVVLPTLRACLSIPVVGVVPAIKPAAHLTKNNCIGILATPGTIQRTYTARLVEKYASHCQVVSVGNVDLVQLAEDKLQGKPVSQTQLKRILQPFLQRTLVPDHIVLGCTHFPWLKDELTQCVSGSDITWIDSAYAVARRVISLLENKNNVSGQNIQHLSFCTRAEKMAMNLQRALLQRGLSEPQLLSINTHINKRQSSHVV